MPAAALIANTIGRSCSTRRRWNSGQIAAQRGGRPTGDVDFHQASRGGIDVANPLAVRRDEQALQLACRPDRTGPAIERRTKICFLPGGPARYTTRLPVRGHDDIRAGGTERFAAAMPSSKVVGTDGD